MLAGVCRNSLAMIHAVAEDGLGNFAELHGAPPPRRHCAAADDPPEGIKTTETWTDACKIEVSATLLQHDVPRFQLPGECHLVLQSCHAPAVESWR